MPKCSCCGKIDLFLLVSDEGLCKKCLEKALSDGSSELQRLKSENEQLQKKHETLSAQVEDEEATCKKIEKRVTKDTLQKLDDQISKRKKELESLQSQIVQTNDELLLQSFGLYSPHFSFVNADEYKSRLLQIRAMQKDMIRDKTAVTGKSTWTVNGSAASGKKMVSDTQKLLLRAFNAECDDVVEHVKYNNVDASEKRITSSKDAISKLGIMMGIAITPEYYKLKIDELFLAFEYQQKKQEEKEAQKEARAQLREEAKLAKELEAQRAKLEKEQTHYQNALEMINAQLAKADEGSRAAIEEKKKQIEDQLSVIGKEFADVDYRAANQKAGYVYIISNIGAFGENVFKIGMTRRLDPMDRVDELGDASVPFNFDVHAMIFSDDAPKLEAALHNAFADRKLNFVNQRREFFNVTLAEIKDVVKKNFDRSVEFVEFAPAEQYRETLLLKEQQKGKPNDQMH